MEDIQDWLNKLCKDLNERYGSPQAAKAATAVALAKIAAAEARAKAAKAAAADTSQQEEAASDTSSDEETWQRCDLGREHIKQLNEEKYKYVIDNKDTDEKIIKQQWKMTEMHGSLEGKYHYEETMQQVKEKRYRFGEESKPDDCHSFVAGDARKAIKAKYESWCWDLFFLGFEWYKLSRFYGDEVFNSVHTLQIYTLKLTREAGEDQGTVDNDDSDSSLHVYGLLHLFSATGCLYHVMFDRKREDCQTLTKEDPYLLLTGPALPPRAPEDELRVQGTLKLKKSTATDQSEDDDTFLSLSLALGQEGKMTEMADEGFHPTGKHYLLEMTRCIVIFSLVATISVKVDDKDFLLHQHCRFTAFTASLQDMKVVLLDSRHGKVSVDVNGMVQLSRRTVAVESGGSLKVVIERGGCEIEELDFSTPKTDDHAQYTLVYDSRDVQVSGSGTIQVKVAWSHWWDKFRSY